MRSRCPRACRPRCPSTPSRSSRGRRRRRRSARAQRSPGAEMCESSRACGEVSSARDKAVNGLLLRLHTLRQEKAKAWRLVRHGIGLGAGEAGSQRAQEESEGGTAEVHPGAFQSHDYLRAAAPCRRPCHSSAVRPEKRVEKELTSSWLEALATNTLFPSGPVRYNVHAVSYSSASWHGRQTRR